MADAEPKRLTRDQCLAKAKECRELDKQASSVASHAAMLEAMAQSWEQMANDYRIAERRSD